MTYEELKSDFEKIESLSNQIQKLVEAKSSIEEVILEFSNKEKDFREIVSNKILEDTKNRESRQNSRLERDYMEVSDKRYLLSTRSIKEYMMELFYEEQKNGSKN